MKVSKCDLFTEEFIKIYDENMERLFHSIVLLNSSYFVFITIVNSEVGKYPLNSDNAFFNLTLNNYYEYMIISLYKILGDNGIDTKKNLFKFKNEILKNINCKYKDELFEELKNVYKEKDIKNTLEKLVTYRTTKVAHDIFKENIEVFKVTISEIKLLIDYCVSIFTIISFNTTFKLILSEYDVENSERDIDIVIRSAITQSKKFKHYIEIETNLPLIENYRANFPDELEKVNIVREKYGYSIIR